MVSKENSSVFGKKLKLNNSLENQKFNIMRDTESICISLLVTGHCGT